MPKGSFRRKGVFPARLETPLHFSSGQPLGCGENANSIGGVAFNLKFEAVNSQRTTGVRHGRDPSNV